MTLKISNLARPGKANQPEARQQQDNVVFLPANQASVSPAGSTSSDTEFGHAMFLCRITGLRNIGDSFGDFYRDTLMQLAEARLRKCLRDGDYLEQVATDEFAISLTKPGTCANLAGIARRLLNEASGTYMLDDMHFRVRAVIGINASEEAEPNIEESIRHARIAARGVDHTPNTPDYHFFSRELLEYQRNRVCMSAEIERALQDGRMHLHYQPQYDLASGAVVSVEALIRMESEQGELIPPDRFIPIAEDNGLILNVGHWVVRESCKQLRRWREAGLNHFKMSVNVSPRQLTDPRLTSVIDEAIQQNDLEYSDLTLELTEQCIVEQLDAAQHLLNQLRNRGVRIAIDDFGTGFSSFSYLSTLPVDVIKLDRSFLLAVPADERANRTLAAMVAMAEKLELDMIVEGVETTEQETFLVESGCRLGQGFGLARPHPVDTLQPMLLAG